MARGSANQPRPLLLFADEQVADLHPPIFLLPKGLNKVWFSRRRGLGGDMGYYTKKLWVYQEAQKNSLIPGNLEGFAIAQ